MAIDPSAVYPASQIDTTDPTGYPLGEAQNVTLPGDGTGTPLEKNWLSDLWGFLQALLAEDSASPSGTPDKVGASQYLTAIKNMITSGSQVAETLFSGSVDTLEVSGRVQSTSAYSGLPDAAGDSIQASWDSTAISGEVGASWAATLGRVVAATGGASIKKTVLTGVAHTLDIGIDNESNMFIDVTIDWEAATIKGTLTTNAGGQTTVKSVWRINLALVTGVSSFTLHQGSFGVLTPTINIDLTNRRVTEFPISIISTFDNLISYKIQEHS